MDPELERCFDRLEARKSALFDRVAGISDDVLSRSPGEGEWSVLEILAHLCLVEQLSVAHVQEQMSKEAPPAGVGSWLRSRALSLAMRSPLRIKAPARATELPETASLDEVRERWDSVRIDLVATFAEVPPRLASTALFRHPRMGRLTLSQAARFIEEHIDHHRRQVERVLSRVG